MKRSTTVEEVKQRGKDPKDPAIKKAYKVFKDQQELKKQLENDENEWNTYEADNFNDQQKKEFEFYFCGWLQYYDEISRNGGIDHTLYFKWSSYDVVVYISPAPGNSLKPITGPPAAGSTLTSDPKSPSAPPPPYP